jgi:hypothetical protein
MPPDALPKPPPPPPRQQRHREAKRRDFLEAEAMNKFVAQNQERREALSPKSATEAARIMLKSAGEEGASPKAQAGASPKAQAGASPKSQAGAGASPKSQAGSSPGLQADKIASPKGDDITILPADATEEEVQAKSYGHLKQVLFWQAEHGHEEDVDIPVEILQQAFQEIDVDFSGEIDTSELLYALRQCGLPASERATESIVKEIDINNSGDIDVHEFVDFFRQIQELQRQKKEVRGQSNLRRHPVQTVFHLLHCALRCVVHHVLAGAAFR